MNIEAILISLGQDKKVAMYTQIYITAFLPGLYVMSHIDLHRRFLNSLGKNYVPMICMAFGVYLHEYTSEYFVNTLDMGI